MHFLRQIVADGMLQHEGSAALTGLAVNADNRLVFTMDIRRVNRQIRYLPIFCTAVFHVFITLADSILMRTAEGGEGQLTGVRLTLRHMHFCAFLINLFDVKNMREIQLGINILRKHVEGYSYDIQVTGTLAVTEQRTFDTVRTGQKCQLGAGNARTTVIMRMHADYCCFTVFNMTAEVFNLIGICIRRTHFNSRGQVEDNRVFFCRAHFLHYSLANCHREIYFRTGKAFRRIFIADIHTAAGNLFFRQLADKARALYSNIGNTVHILAKNNFTLQC